VFKPLSANAYSSIRCNFEFDSNVTEVSDVQLAKQYLHTTSTDAGTSILLKPLLANALASIRCNLEFDSNVTDVSDVQCKKQDSLTISILDSITTAVDCPKYRIRTRPLISSMNIS
jgi:hypothetical protein